MHDLSFEERLARVDLSKVMASVAAEHGLTADEAQQAEDLYRKFLTLKARYPDKILVPPRIVDFVWHGHITSTRQYMSDCSALFGRYVHHDMYEADDALLSEGAQFTENAFISHFHYPIGEGLSPEYSRMACCGSY